MWWKWLPWRYLLRRAARTHGFLDPLSVLARLQRFSQPAEVAQPVELLRAGALFHARGLLNSQVIQHNRDWVWPYWIERQFDPADPAFLPRAFSITHVNLTHRNWTCVGLPDLDSLPIVDPRGLVTPFWDGWSLDVWLLGNDDRLLLPSRAPHTEQRLLMTDPLGLAVETMVADPAAGTSLISRAWVEHLDGPPRLRLAVTGSSPLDGWLAVSVRPCNPEGVSLIHSIALEDGDRAWLIDDDLDVMFDEPVERHHASTYQTADVFIHLHDRDVQKAVTCPIGMATAAALFRVTGGESRSVSLSVPLAAPPSTTGERGSWAAALQGAPRLTLPDRRYEDLFAAGLRTLVLLSPDDVYPGPYTYKRFWFRDAAFMLHALLCCNLHERVARALDRFPHRQTTDGFFRSQEGEWDANGQVLWILDRFRALTGRPLPSSLAAAARRGADWIVGKRLPDGPQPHDGLMPAGFSAEHLGPPDYYYWDDWWSIAGLHAATRLFEQDSQAGIEVERWRAAAAALRRAVDRSLALVADRLHGPTMPASPYRRMDSGAVGSLAAGYPLQLVPPDDAALLATAQYLHETCRHGGALFHDVVHSGVNPYLTLHLAQVLLRAGSGWYPDLVRAVADAASETGQWPEAIHPRTGGGCMGDGQHGWAAAEWILMIRNAFVREEEGGLVVASGLLPEWLDVPGQLAFGPAATDFGLVSVALEVAADTVTIRCQADWRDRPPTITAAPPGFLPRAVPTDSGHITLRRQP